MRIPTTFRAPALAGLGALAGTLALCTAPAAAFQSYSPDFTFGSFSDVQGIAVDEGEGEVFVYDHATGAVHKFNTLGQPREFTGLGADEIAVGSNQYAAYSELAVDNSTRATSGDLYAAVNGGSVLIYSSATGEELGELNANVATEVPGAPWGAPCGVAVDPTGKVYIGFESGVVNRYTPAGSVAVNKDYSGSLWGLGYEACNVAADAAGTTYVVKWEKGPIERYPATDFNEIGTPAAATEVDASGSTLAVDPATGDVFVDEQGSIAQFAPGGEPPALIARFAAGEIKGSLGIALDDQNDGELYVDAAAGGPIAAYKLITITPPTVADQPPTASPVGKHEAALRGTIDPGQGDTHYQFQYGTSTAYGQRTPLADAGNGTVDVQTATVVIGELQPDTTYHYRLVATNVAGTAEGPDETFTTEALTPPSASVGPATAIGASAATLTAAADTQGLTGTYTFELATSPGESLAVAFGTLATQPEAQALQLPLAGLAPATTYYYRITVTTADGTSQSSEASFTTAADPLPPASAITSVPDLSGFTPLPATVEPVFESHKKHAEKKPRRKAKRKAKKARKRANKSTSSKDRSAR
jgi:hypothetical protein